MDHSRSSPTLDRVQQERRVERKKRSPLAGKRVLLAEDDASSRRIVAGVLREMGLDVIETEDGGRMLVAITSQYKDEDGPDALDLIVTDVQMPIASGLDIFARLRSARWKTPVIVITGHDAPDVRAEVRALGAVLLTKPLDLAELERTVHELLEGRK